MRQLFDLDKNDYAACTHRFVRNSARAVILSGGRIAMVHSLKYDHYKFPGGGIRPGEDPAEAMIRETREEAGLAVVPGSVREYGLVHRIQKSQTDETECFVQDNYYYLCEVYPERVVQQLDDYEAEERYMLEYVEPEEAIRVNRAPGHGPKERMMLEREARVLELLLAEGYFGERRSGAWISGHIDYLGLDRVLRRGSGEIVAEREGALLIRDRISGAYLLACEEAAAGQALLEAHIGPDCTLLMVSDPALGNAAFERFGFAEKLECWQFAYYGEKPAETSGLRFRTAQAGDLPLLTSHYHLISPEEMAAVAARQSLLIGFEGERPVGFIGEHLEGSMGILYVFPDCRRRGFGAALQKHLMAQTMEKGLIPFGQVEKENAASLKLQEKLGMTRSGHRIVWMWR